ncbi:MAG TPA: DnaJ C-terminal domain-containing protein [Pirellulales bacterium]|nr:DnaJ C-terminal domain-containing protein [Pirellulales bacterium]
MAEDYYKSLDINRGASQAEIDKAYAKLARKFHPDVNPDDKNAKKKFQEIQAAYDVLKDPKKRELYDRYGSAFEQAAQGGGPRAGGTWSSNAGPEGFDFAQFFGGEAPGGFGDIFSQMRRRGGGPRRGRAAGGLAGADVTAQVEIPFNLAVSGGETQLTLQHESGETETLTVKIPAGIEDGKKLRLRGRGDPGLNGGPRGNLFVTVRVASHPYFTRRGDHLYVRLPLTLREAAEGAKVDVPTPQGTVSLRVPPGSSSGRKLRIKGHGVAVAGRPPGDLFAEVQIMIPPDLDESALANIREIDARWPMSPRRDVRW